MIRTGTFYFFHTMWEKSYFRCIKKRSGRDRRLWEEDFIFFLVQTNKQTSTEDPVTGLFMFLLQLSDTPFREKCSFRRIDRGHDEDIRTVVT